MKYSFMSMTKSLFFLLLSVGVWSCQTSAYQATVDRELATGVEHNELIFDMRIGQTQKEFYGACWQLNKEKLVAQGPSNQYVRHVLDSVSPIYQPDNRMEMLFFGLFDDDKIMQGMRFRFTYTAWAPWNKELQPNELQKEVKTMMMNLFPGNDFFDLSKKVNGNPISVKIDGNRLITVHIHDNRYVQAYIEDLNAKYNG